jgi:hypothetical protein
MTDWEHDDALRDSLLTDILEALPKPARPGDVTLEEFIRATGYTRPRARYQLDRLVETGALATEMCDIEGRTVRVWRKPS